MPVDKDPEKRETDHLLHFGDFAGKRVLEVGCGDGRLTWRYASRALRVVGIDVDRDALRIAHIERPWDLADKAVFVEATSVRLPFHKESFDMAVLAWSF
ncbi:MAG: class I SAM-dependent methyltransferase [Anaerolineales bacterium]